MNCEIINKEIEYEFILICATGRSGSTTLQRIINTIPNTNICGENNNAILNLLNFYKSLKHQNVTDNNKVYSIFVDKNIKPCWYNHFDMTQIISDIKKMIIHFLNFTNTNTILGFKEIRYDKTNFHLLNEFKELFPKTKIIIHIRNDIKSQSQSDWFSKDKNSFKKLTKYNKEFLTFYEKKDNLNKYFSCFEDLFDINKIKILFKFLNKEEFFNEIEILKILNNNQQ